MDEDALISAVAKRASNPATRTDWADRWSNDLAYPATLEQVDQAERALYCKLHHLHRRLLQEVGNGGFGPGGGLIGLPGGKLGCERRSVVELREQLLGDEAGDTIPVQVVPLCDWGDGAWSCLDETTGHVLVLDEGGLTDTGLSLYSYMSDWVDGVSLSEKLFEFEEHSGINPFTKKVVMARLRGRPIGIPYAGKPMTHT